MQIYHSSIYSKLGAQKAYFMVCAMSAWMFLGFCSSRLWASSGNSSPGEAAVRSGEYEKARQYFESALNDKEDLEKSQAGLLHTLRLTGTYQEAAKRSADFLSTRDDSALLHFERGRILEAIGDYAAAEKHLRRSLALALGGSALHMDAMRVLAELLEEVGQKSDARSLWDRLIEEYRTGKVQGSRQLGDVAMAAWRLGYVQDAKDIFMDATDPKLGDVSLESLSNFGYLFLEKYNATAAMSVFRDCLKINKSYPDALVGMALAKKYDNDLEVEIYSKAALKTNPNLVPALNVLAELAMEAENQEAALHEIKAALAVNPASLESLALMAVYQYFRGDTSGFSQTEHRILEINPSYGRFYYTLAENLVSRRKYQEAVNFDRKAINLDPELWSAYASLGMNLTRIGDWTEGRKAIQLAFDGDPFNVWAFNYLDLFDQMDTFVKGRSKHFTFQMSREDAPILEPYASDLAEEAYTKLTQRYGFEPQGPLQIEIFPDHGGFAVRTLGLPGLGGALGVCFGKVVAIDSPRAHKIGSFNWGTTLWHEFTHVITLQMTRHNIPRWYSEGLSVYEEHRARPGWGDNLTSSFVKAYKEGRLLKASELNSGFTRPQNPEQILLSYYQAALVCEWIEEKYGFEKIRQSLLLFSENRPAEEVFRQTLGLDVAEMDEEYGRFIDSRVKEIASHLIFAPPDNAALEMPPRAGGDKETLTRRLRNNSDDFYANLQMGTLLLREGSRVEAESYLKKAQTLFPQYVEPGNPYQLLGQMYLETKRESDALAEYEKWRRMDGDSAEPLIQAAAIYRKRNDLPSVEKMLCLSIYVNPYNMDVQKQVGEAAMESGEWEAAVSAYQVLLALDTTDPAEAHYDLARALLASGKTQEAKREILRSLEIAPSYIKAQKLLLKINEGPIE
jgi:tetratricopeptide (TPR) repeat protein